MNTDLLVQFICHAPPIPMGYLERRTKPNEFPEEIPHAERHALWRVEYAMKQIELMEKVGKKEDSTSTT